MPALHLSKSEIFFYGALSQRLGPLLRQPGNEDNRVVFDCYPAAVELWPKTVDPFSQLQQLAIEFGIARRIELEPAGDNEELPFNPEYRDPLPEDVVWTFADGTPLGEGECDAVQEQLDQAHAEGAQDYGEVERQTFWGESATHPANLLDLMTGMPQWVPMNVRQRCFKELADAMGDFVMEGYSPSEPGYVFRVTWRNDTYRFRVPQQENQLYASLLQRFEREFNPPQIVLWSLGRFEADSSDYVRNVGPVTRADVPRLVQWLETLHRDFRNEKEWELGYHLAAGLTAARLLETYLISHEADIAKSIARGAGVQGLSTRDRIEHFIAYLPLVLEDRVRAFEASGRRYDEPSPEETPVIDMRFLCGIVAEEVGVAMHVAKDIGLAEVGALADGGWARARRFDQPLKGIGAGVSSFEELRRGARELTDTASDAMKLAYGQLYFRELADEQVYIDPGTRAKLLREPKAIREQIAEAISQYERQTLPNCTVTSACGLIEPVVRGLAAKWLPAGAYGGDTAGVLKALLDSLRQRSAEIRAEAEKTGNPHPEAARNLEQLYCANLAFALHSLGNSVRHYPEKVLKRHDAGVMLHGLCSLIQRTGG